MKTELIEDFLMDRRWQMGVILYSTDCPMCKVLKTKLDEVGLKYEVCSDKDLMIEMGFKSVPMLDVGGVHMTFTEAIKWLNDNYKGDA